MTKMKRLLCAVCPLLVITAACVWAEEVGDIEGQATVLVKAGKLEEALVLLKKITEDYPDYGGGFMNYGAILFNKARAQFESADKKEEGKNLFKEVEGSFRTAIRLFGDDPGYLPKKAQCFFLMGQIRAHVFTDDTGAIELYRETLEINPQHGGAISELRRLKVYKPEKPLIKFDGRKWKVGFERGAGNQEMTEWVLEGETVENWSELVTANYAAGLNNVDLDDYVSMAQRGLKAQCSDVKFDMISRSETEVVYEWSASKCQGNPDQSEVARALITDKGFHILHYATKKIPMPADKRKTWLERLGEVTIAKS